MDLRVSCERGAATGRANSASQAALGRFAIQRVSSGAA